MTTNEPSDKNININPQQIVIDYIDSLIDYVETYTDIQLCMPENLVKTIEIPAAAAAVDNDDLLNTNDDENDDGDKETDPFDVSNNPCKQFKGYTHFNSSSAGFLPSGSTLPASEYFQMVRDEMTKNLLAAKHDALKQLETCKAVGRLDEDYNSRVDRVMAKAFAKRFPVIIKFELVKTSERFSWLPAFEFLLLELDFYIGKNYWRIFL